MEENGRKDGGGNSQQLRPIESNLAGSVAAASIAEVDEEALDGSSAPPPEETKPTLKYTWRTNLEATGPHIECPCDPSLICLPSLATPMECSSWHFTPPPP